MISQIPPLPEPPDDDAPARADVEQLERDNDATVARLRVDYGIGIDPWDALRIRLNLLAETLLGDMDAPARRRHEHRVQTYFLGQLDRIESQARRAKLLQGITLPGAGDRPNGGGLQL